MKPPTETTPRTFQVVGVCLLAAAALGAAYGQAPLYYSNQNQYFLHGLANAGYGLLHDDWLSRTLDPVPVFSGLVTVTARFLHPWAFYVYHAMLVGAYAVALLGLFAVLAGQTLATRRWPIFVALLVLVHSAAARWSSYQLLGQDFPYYFQAGVAGQYVLGAMFQPSMFGVLLIVAIVLFVRDYPLLAVVCVAGVATVHATYLLPAGMLTLGFVVVLVQEKRFRMALGAGTLALILVLPTVVHALITFRPTSAETFAQAQDILVNVRIPHHSRPDLWLDEIAGLQVAWVVIGTALAWRTRLFAVLAIPLVLSALLTLAQMGTASQPLALLFPWRVSVVLVPVATTVVLTRLVALCRLPLERWELQVSSVVVLLALAGAGLWITFGRHAFHTANEEMRLLEHVRQAKKPGEVYLLPVQVPKLATTTRGSLSSDFKPLANKREDARVIPVDLQRFRIDTGAPIFVDFKSIPYKDTEVLEWRYRLDLAEEVQKWIDQGRLPEALEALRSRGVTHLVRPAGQKISGHGLHQVHEDPYYRVYRLDPGPEDPARLREGTEGRSSD